MHRAEGRAARPGPSLPTWCKYRAKPRHAVKDSPRDARRTLNGILRTSRRLGVRIEDLGRVRGAQLLLGNHGHRKKAHDPDFLSAGILFALMVAVLAGVLAAMLVADPDRPADRPGNKSMGGGQDADLLTGVSGADPDDGEVAEDVVEYLQHPRHQQQGDFILGYHDDYRERYDGFDQPPPFRQRHKPREKARPRPSDLEISEEEAFSTRVFVTTPRRQR